MKTRLLSFLAGIFAVLFLLEIIFRILPVATATQGGYYQDPLILSYPARHCFIASTGWDLKDPQHICTNNAGFVADHDFVVDPAAVGVIGDSYVEGYMLPAESRIGAALERQLGGRPVYAFGGPGSNLLDYAVRAKFAAKKFGIRTFIFILERNDVKQVLCGSGHVHGVCMDARSGQIKTVTQAPPGPLKRILRESALAQYLVSQLKIDPSKLPWNRRTESFAGGGNGPALSALQQKAAVDYFFQQILTIEGGHFVFVIDPDRAHLLEQAENEQAENEQAENEQAENEQAESEQAESEQAENEQAESEQAENEQAESEQAESEQAESEQAESEQAESEQDGLLDMMRDAGSQHAVVIDPSDEFRKYLVDTHKILAVGPYDLHWNGDAVEIVARLAGNALASQER